jgi:PAS domain S-box-containing protein
MAYQGFSQQFYETESPLSINTDKCMCINVVKGTTDPGLPFYTKRGSFYMNGTTRFLATVSEKDKGETRNVCNQVGYESVALIPIRGDSHIMGLIHLADHKENMVPLSMVKLLEQAASALGAGIQRALAEEALRQSEQRWATTLASIGDGVIATDVEGRITFMNVVAEGLTGWTLSEASQKPVTEVFNIINEQTRKEVDNPVSKVLQAGNVVGLGNHTVLVSKDGTEVPIDDSGAPIRGESGNISGVVLVFRDITERKRAEEELRRHQDELEDRVRERTVELRESEERLRQLSTELLNAQEKERRAVAQEIHDSIGASLSAAKFKVESAIGQLSADAPQTKALLEGVIPIIQETANTTTLSL